MRTLFVLTILFCSVQAMAQSKEAEIDKMMRYAASQGYFNGSIAVLEKGNVVYSNSFGYANFHTEKKNDANSIYELASVTKQFTAMAVMMLQERGLLSYADSLRKFFPQLPYRGISILQMLHHTSGLPDYMREISFVYWDPEKIYTNQDALNELIKYKLPIHFKPGEKFEYSNTGYMLLALIVEQVSGESFETFLSKNIFIPLGMTNSGIFTRYANMEDKSGSKLNIAHGFMYDVQANRFELPENIPQLRIVRSMGGLYGDGLIGSSVTDQIKWHQGLFSGKLLKKETLQEAFESGKLNDGRPCGYGFGWFLQHDPTDGAIAQHTGGWSGVRNAIVRWIDKDRVLIVLRNNEIDFRGIQDAVKNILNGQPYQMPKPSLMQALAFASVNNTAEPIRKKFNDLRPDKAIINEQEINQLGYFLTEANKLNAAIEVLKINTELFPQSWNTFDSLGEVYLKAGNKDLAKLNYRKSIELNPGNEGARKALDGLGG